MTEIIAPAVNINGTSRKELLRQCIEARAAVIAAFKALQGFSPHGRDYQTLSPDVYRAARHQHNTWLGQLDDMANALEEIGIQLL